jgi:DNA-binding FadR family transcriptional regulator
MVVRRATPGDLQRMHMCCAAADAADTHETFEHWDSLLHEAIADATHNNFISSVFRLMNHIRTRGAWGELKLRSAKPERRRAYQGEHRELVAALTTATLHVRSRSRASTSFMCVETCWAARL